MDTPTIVERDATTVAGLQAHYAGDDAEIERRWQEFGERWDEFEAVAASDEAVGVVTNFDEQAMEFDYLVGVPTTETDLPEEFVVVEIPAGTYAVFETTLETFQEDYDEATREWLPESGYEKRAAPEFERYGPEYDPDEPNPAYEYFLPVVEAE